MVLHAIEHTSCCSAVATGSLASFAEVVGTELDSAGHLDTVKVPDGQVLELLLVSLVAVKLVIGHPSYWCWPFGLQVITLTLQRFSY